MFEFTKEWWERPREAKRLEYDIDLLEGHAPSAREDGQLLGFVGKFHFISLSSAFLPHFRHNIYYYVYYYYYIFKL